MPGKAVQLNPHIAKEIVKRGHEVVSHGLTWDTAILHMTKEEEYNYFKADTELL